MLKKGQPGKESKLGIASSQQNTLDSLMPLQQALASKNPDRGEGFD